MPTNLFDKLRTAQEHNALPTVIAYNRIDGPGSSLDIREFQQALWHRPDLPADLKSDPSFAWSRGLPRTIGITIDLGTVIEAHPLKDGYIGIRSIEYNQELVGKPGEIPPTKVNWLLKILDVFNFSGVQFVLHNLKAGVLSAGLGGSATVATGVCLLANELSGRPFTENQLIALASRIETDLGISITGTQEQSNVVFGGVVDYLWCPWGIPGQPDSGYGSSIRTELLTPDHYQELEARMAIFHSGISRASADTNAVWRDALTSPDGYRTHIRKAQIAYHFREALRLQQWNQVRDAFENYRQARTNLCPKYMDGASEIHERAKALHSAAFPLGAGGGGAILVFSPDPKTLNLLREELKNLYQEIPFRIKPKGHQLINMF